MSQIDTRILELAGITPTSDTHLNAIKLFKWFADVEQSKKDEIITYMEKLVDYPFTKFFYHGTNIGECIEEVLADKFIDIVPKELPRYDKRTNKLLKSKKKNPIYAEYHKKHGTNSKQFEYLVESDTHGEYPRLEIKVIRAVESKEDKKTRKYDQVQQLLVERALTKSQGSGGNGTFQQTKPDLFDHMLCVVVYLDCVDLFLVPSSAINKEENIIITKAGTIGGHLILSPQHAHSKKNANGTYQEGHLSLDDLKDYHIASYDSEEKLFASESLNKYIQKIYLLENNDRNI